MSHLSFSQDQNKTPSTSRRRFMRDTTSLAAASTLVASSIPNVHAAESNEIRVAIVGCGGRGTGAVDNALSVKNGPIKLVAMADVFQNKLESSYGKLKEKFGERVDVPEEDRKSVV